MSIEVNIISPSKATISFSTAEEALAVKNLCSFKNKSVEFQYRRHQKNARWRSYDQAGWKAHGDTLKSQIEHSVLFIEDGKVCIRPGFAPYLEAKIPGVKIINSIAYPKPKPYPWYRKPQFDPYPYQKESVELLINEKHGNVELCTGAGKSLAILMLCQRLGLKTLVVTPSVSIFNEILESFEHHFGKSTIGALGDGKKRLGKNIIISVSDSVAGLKPGSKEYKEISGFQLLLADESHTIPSKTLEKMAHGVLKDIPYRFFFSGTQTRGDGTEKMLMAIIGKTVKTLSTKDAIAGGYVCDHEFKIVGVETSSPGYKNPDALAMKRSHLLNNENISDFIVKLSKACKVSGEKILVLVDELPQILSLLKKLDTTVAVATSTDEKNYLVSLLTGKKKTDVKKLSDSGVDVLNSLDEEQRKIYDKIKDSDPKKSVDEFNSGKANILIGTSCISTGTNIFPTHHTVNWQGGTSEIKTKQGAVGRSVRKLENSKYKDLHPAKPKSTIWDFKVKNVDVMDRHLATRVKFYKESGTLISYIFCEENDHEADDG